LRLLHLYLSSGDVEKIDVPENQARAYIGGASLAARLLLPRFAPEIPPLAPESPLLLLTGPLTGTAGPAVGRCVFAARSPATGLWGESNIGGHLGPELRAAGLDGLLVSGRAAAPSYLWISDGRIEIRSARGLWGALDTYACQDAIRALHGDARARVACIGPAGEQQIPSALILCDHGRVAGRTGMGAVMGSKNLKAIAVRGREPIPLARPDEYARLRHEANRALRDDNFTRTARQMGTAAAMDYFAYLGTMPSRYFTGGTFENAGKLSGPTVAETILTRVSACQGCVIACGRVVRLEDGEERKGAEYETTVGFGPQLGIDDLHAVTRLGEKCDRLGVDTISVSGVIGLAYLLYERGYLTTADTDGEELTWGNAAAADRLIDRLVRRQGFGELLAQGSRALAMRVGAPDLAAQVNGLEAAYHDPRGASGMALAIATSPRGACHMQSDYFMVDVMGHTVESIGVNLFDRQAGAEKAGNVARHQDWRAVGSSLVMCRFANVAPEAVLELVNAATGFDYALEEFIACGERGWTVKRLVNCGFGLTAANDTLPAILRQPLASGGSAGYELPFEAMLEAYYRARGWDPITGRPNADVIARLGLEDVAGESGRGAGQRGGAARPRVDGGAEGAGGGR
jgi:aldehyde:ferredoxin oxidoreductase